MVVVGLHPILFEIECPVVYCLLPKIVKLVAKLLVVYQIASVL